MKASCYCHGSIYRGVILINLKIKASIAHLLMKRMGLEKFGDDKTAKKRFLKYVSVLKCRFSDSC